MLQVLVFSQALTLYVWRRPWRNWRAIGFEYEASGLISGFPNLEFHNFSIVEFKLTKVFWRVFNCS